ncbi:MAG: diaminopimelate epimerase [Gemmatimonadaceae bacterium]|nr:diaminopimelate epimerase [Gemmatimonadaceae bacterium]
MLLGRRFWKMSGSGNDFVFFDAMLEPAGSLSTPESIGRLCERRTGVGADGVVFLEPHSSQAFMMRYFNRDGSLAEMCGNAALCSTRLARDLGIVGQGDFAFETVSGPVTGRFVDGEPEIDMVPVTEMQSDYATDRLAREGRIGFARVGVRHLVVLVDDVRDVEVERRGRELRLVPSLRDGANANFVSKGAEGRWIIRTYERGVEEETFACGTGAVATAALLTTWGLADGPVVLATRSGRDLTARVPALAEDHASAGELAPHEATARQANPPVLRGEGRIVFEGFLGEF